MKEGGGHESDLFFYVILSSIMSFTIDEEKKMDYCGDRHRDFLLAN